MALQTDLKRQFTIGALAKAASVNIQTVRFYEREGLLDPIGRKSSGYRVYDKESLKRLSFIRQAKDFGFGLKEIRELLSLNVRTVERCNKVRTRAVQKLKDVQERISNLKKLEKTLKGLVDDCENRVVSDCCPILEKMEVKSGTN